MLGRVLTTLIKHLIHTPTSITIIPILKIKKLKIREVKKFDLKIRGRARTQILGSLTPKSEFVTHMAPKIINSG